MKNSLICIVFLACIFLVSCATEVKQEETSSGDTTKALIKTIAITDVLKKEWTQLYIEEDRFYEPCNPTTIQFHQNSETGNWQLLQSDLLSAESPKIIVSSRVENNRVILNTIGHEGDTLYYVLERNLNVRELMDISFYASEDDYRNNEKTTSTYYVRGEFKGVIPPAEEECDFGDQPEVFIDSSYVVDNTFCNLQNGEEEAMKLQFKLVCKKDGSLSGTANYDAGVGLAQFSKGTWQMEGQGVSFTIVTAGQFQANGDSLVEYSREISIGSFYELQAYKQCK